MVVVRDDREHRREALMNRACRPVVALADRRRPWFRTCCGGFGFVEFVTNAIAYSLMIC
jgi:hypothetical protein